MTAVLEDGVLDADVTVESEEAPGVPFSALELPKPLTGASLKKGFEEAGVFDPLPYRA